MSVTDNTSSLKSSMANEFRAILKPMAEQGMHFAEDAIENGPWKSHYHEHRGVTDSQIIDTGRLYNELVTTTREENDSFEAYIGSDTEYALETHETGSWGGRLEPRPFLQEGLSENSSYFQTQIENAFSKAMAGFD